MAAPRKYTLELMERSVRMVFEVRLSGERLRRGTPTVVPYPVRGWMSFVVRPSSGRTNSRTSAL